MWYNEYVGIPFLAKGRDKTGADCWGLVRLIYDEQFNIKLPSFSEDYEENDVTRMGELFAQYQEGWEKTTEPKPGSVILFKVLGHVSHIGVYIGNNKFLHSRENHSSVIETLDKVEWANRQAGFFNYTEKSSAVLNVVPHPLRTERWTVPVPEGSNIAQLSEWVLEKFEIPKELDSHITVLRNGVVVPRELYSTTIILDSDTIEYRAVPGKSLFRIFLVVAIIIAAPYVAQALATTMGVTSTAGISALTAGVATIGQLLLGALMPIRPPKPPSDPGSSEAQLLVNGGSNTVNKYGAIPVVLGRVRMTPVLGGENYVDSNTDNSFLNMLLVWGFGPLHIERDSYRIGLNSFSQYENGAGVPISYATLNDAVTADDTTDLLTFNRIYGSDRQQVYLGTTLSMHTTPENINVDYGDGLGSAGPWIEASLSQTNTTRIDVNLHFPQGLRRLRVKGKKAGDIYEKEVKVAVQLRQVDVNGVLIPGKDWGSAFTATYPATTVIANRAFDGTTAKYRWTRIGIGPNGVVVKEGPLLNSPSDANGIGGAAQYVFGMLWNSTTPNVGVAKPSFASNELPLVDVCTYGNTLYTTDSSIKSGSLSGFAITTGGIASVNYTTANWANPAAGADTGDTLVSIGVGTRVVSGTSVISLGTEASRLFVKRKDAFSYTISLPTALIPNEGYYQVRVRRMTDDRAEPDEDNRDMQVMVLQTITATANNKPIVENSNWRLTKTALRVKANEQLNGRIEGINAIVQTICKDWDGTQWTVRKSNNPASLFLYILEHPANAYRVAPADVTSKINMTALKDWHVFCSSNGYTFNSVVASQRSVLDVLRDICAAGRASPAMVDGKWTVVIDNQKNDVIQHFTPHNSWGFESTKRLPKQPHALRATYLNQDKDWQEDEAFVYNAGYAATAGAGKLAAEIFEQISLPGITTHDLCTKHARWHLAQAALRPEVFTLNTDLEYLVCNRGDRVKVLHDVPMWGMASGRIKSKLTALKPTGITAATGTATATFAAQVYVPFTVGSTITIAGSSIAGYNGNKTVTACTTTSVSWTDATTGTATFVNPTRTTTAISVTSKTATASFTTLGYVPYSVGSTIVIKGAVPDAYNGTKTVTACTTTSVSWLEGPLAAATTNGTISGNASISTTTPSVFTLDEQVALVAPTVPGTVTYNIRVRSKTGTSSTRSVQAVTVNGYYNTIKLTTTAPASDIDNNDLFMFGELTTESVDLLVLGIEPFGNQNARITLVDYAEKLFTTNYLDANFTIPLYNTKITLPGKNLIQSIIQKPIITSIISDETVMEQISPGSYKLNIRIGFSNPPGIPSNVKYVNAEIDYDGDSVDNWQTTIPVLASTQSIVISGVDELSVYKIRLRYVSEDGRTGPWQSAYTAAVTGIAYNNGILTINTLNRHSFSTGSSVYLYNTLDGNSNGLYTVNTIPTKTSLTSIVNLPLTTLTSSGSTTVQGNIVAGFATQEVAPFPIGSNIAISGVGSPGYNRRGAVTVSTVNTVGFIETLNRVQYSNYNASGWTNGVPTAATITTGIDDPFGGTNAVRFTINSTASALLRVALVPFTPNGTDTYTLSFYCRRVSGTGPSTTADTTDLAPTANYDSQLITGHWVRVVITGVATAVSKTFVDLYTNNVTATQVLDYYGVMLNVGSTPGILTTTPIVTSPTLSPPAERVALAQLGSTATTTATSSTAGIGKLTFTPQTYLPLAVGSKVTLTGFWPQNYNGVKTVTSIGLDSATIGYLTWADPAWGTTPRAATIVGHVTRTADVGTWLTTTAAQQDPNVQGLTSSRFSTQGAYVPENLVHKVIGKTTPPSAVTNFVVVPDYASGALRFNWSASPEIDVQYYEVRTDTNWESEANRIYFGAALTCTTIPASTLSSPKTYYIKAIDYSGNYSVTAATVVYTVVAPNTVVSTPTFSYNSTSLTDTNVTFNWTEPTGSAFAITKYEVTLTRPVPSVPATTVQIVTAPTWTTPANWLGSATLSIKTIDILGNYSVASTPLTTNKTQPQSVGVITYSTAGTGIVLSWPEATAGSVPVLGYEIRSTNSGWGTPGYVYYASATTATIDLKGTAAGTTKTYYIKAYDADNQYSAAATTITYVVAAPTNTTFSTVPATFADTSLTNATVTLSWNAATPVFGLYGYELTYTTTGGVVVTQVINTTSVTLQTGAIWTNPGIGSVTFTLKVIDNLGLTNKSTGVSTAVTKSAPGLISNFTSKVIDNNVLLSWTPPAKTTLPVDHVVIVKGASYATGVSIGDKTGTFTIVFEQTGGDYTYWIAAVDTDNQIGTAVSLTATVASPPDYVFNAEYRSIFAAISTTVTNTTTSSSNVKVKSSENMYVGMKIVLTGTTFGGLTAGYYYVASIIDNTTITISLASDFIPLFVASSTASGSMVLTDAIGTEGINTNSLYDNKGILLPVDSTQTWTTHFASGAGRTWTGPSDQLTYFPYYIQPATKTGYFEEVYNYGKTLASSQITLNYTGTSINTPQITPVISTAPPVNGGAVTVTNTAGSTTVTSTGAGSGGLVVGNFITIPASTDGQTVRIVSTTPGISMVVYPAVVAANTGATFSYAGTWTNYTGTTALGVAFQYVKAGITVNQATRNAGTGTITAPGAVGPSLDLQFAGADSIDSRITFTRASLGSYVDSKGIIRVVSNNVPRLDHDPATLKPLGLLIEEARTNLLLRSEDWTATWLLTNITIGTPTTSPSGLLNATRLQCSTAAATNCYQSSTATATSGVYTIYAKQGSGATDANSFVIYNNTTALAVASITINYTTGAITQNVGTSATATAVGNGFWRIAMPYTTGVTIGNTISVYACFSGGVETAGEYAYIWGAQLETGAFATSYIPTTTVAVTRAIDVARVNTLTPWFSATEGTLVANSTRITSAVATSQGIVGLAAASGIDSIYIYTNAASNVCEIVTGGGSVAGISIAYNTRSAITYKLNDTNGAAGGTAGTTDTACPIPTVTFLQIGNIQGVGNPYPLNGWVSSVTYFPRRLTNAELALVSGTGQVTVTGTGSLFTKTFKVGDTITIPNTAVGINYNITSVTSDTSLGVMVPVSTTMPAYGSATTYAYKGTDLYKLTSLGVKLDAKQKTESGMVVAAAADTLGTIVNFTVPFIDVSSITLASQGTTAITPVYNFFDENTTGTYTVSGTTTCTINVTGHGLIASNQMAYVTFTSGTAPTGRYLITYVNANQFTITLPTAITTSGAVSIYPNSMTVYAFTDAGARVSPSASISWTVRGF